MSTRQIHVFISHAWAYSSHYDTLAEWVFNGNWSFGSASLDFRDFSVPKTHPIHSARNTEALRTAIFNQIARSHVIVIPTGMYANYSDWIQKEIDGAKGYAKPILAVNPRAQERTSGIVVDNSDMHVGWNKNSVVDGIWQLYYKNNK
ncbi:TIR domain-containing protein [Polaromonas sp. YR568]|uniref:TIR domain-containing protein n=1 Tax=Polaromonas sp. YR568 TaxID=1855301 RepID=UPI003137D77C